VAALGLSARAAVAQEVEVNAVKFNNLRAPNGSAGMWLEADVLLDAKPSPSAPGRVVARVKVMLTLGFEQAAPIGAGGAPGAAERKIEFYRTEAECVALDAGRTEVRFYLPPEELKRAQLRGDPKYWGVELIAGGKSLPAAKAAYATSLAAADSRKNFQTRATAAAAVTEGVLLPQYLTVFANEYPRATPSFVRREAR
jgi:hypothetical protein